jgi:acetyl-CoA carboxylase biotin carboxyl carrier protein
VADEVLRDPRPFDVATIKALVQLMARHDVNEIDLRDGPVRMRLLRGIGSLAHADDAPPMAAPPVAHAPAPAAVPPKEAAAAPSRKLTEIKSPAVGTFYAAANPESAPFVKVGDRVTPTTVVGLIEAMKLFNEIKSDLAGRVTRLVAETGSLVKAKQPLVEVEPL